MIGRGEELASLETLFASNKFEFLVMYGRRRVGKTTILRAFAEKHEVAFFSAQEKNESLNLHDFSMLAQTYSGGGYFADFPGWSEAFSYIGSFNGERRSVLIIDEFPFIAKTNPLIKSMLQHAIDHSWKNKNILLILCGSAVSFMVNEVMGYESPLYGRITAKMEVREFSYLEAAAFFPQYTSEEKILAYGILGGIPRYLEAFDPSKSIRDNIRDTILSPSAFLGEEPQFLLRTELREPMIYNSILMSIADGRNKLGEIADLIGEDRNKCAKYLQVLQTLRLVERVVPCTEKEDSRRGIYEIRDNFYRFWYRFVFRNRTYYEMLGMQGALEDICGNLNDYMGPVFEKICRDYLMQKAKKGELPFVPAVLGKWWGTNLVLRRQDDIDVLAVSRDGKAAIFAECKFRNREMPMEEYDDFLNAARAFDKISEKYYMFFSKGGFTDAVRERAARENVTLVGLDELFGL